MQFPLLRQKYSFQLKLLKDATVGGIFINAREKNKCYVCNKYSKLCERTVIHAW